MRQRLLGMAVAGLFAIAASGCDEALSDVAGPTQDLEPTFSSIQRYVFDAADSAGRPACTQCHTSAGRPFPAGGLNLTAGASYAALVNVNSLLKPSAKRVVPFEPDNSYLIHKLEGRPDIFGVRMPMGGPFLADGQIRIIRRWIELGAAND
jgi:hypothetical protein